MNKRLQIGGLLVISALLEPLGNIGTAIAATFGQKEVEQGKFVAIAVPRAAGHYNLLVVEQVTNKKPCWKEMGNNPVRVDPLLVNFDFTGICARSTDSNGFSIRQAGQDLAMNYRLSIKKRGDELVLLGVPESSSQAKPIEIGSSRGLSAGFIKLQLNPGWRFTKRTFNGKTLGHIYFTADSKLASASVAPPTMPKSIDTDSEEKKEAVITKELSEKKETLIKKAVVPKKEMIEKKESTGDSKSLDSKTLPPPNIKAVASGAQTTGSKKNDSTAKVTPPSAIGRGTALTAPKREASNLGSKPKTSSSVKSVTAKSETKVKSETKISTKTALQSSNSHYRVLVKTTDPAQQDQIRTLVPGAFKSTYKGQVAMQVGSFSDKVRADDIIQLLKTNGYKPILEKTTAKS